MFRERETGGGENEGIYMYINLWMQVLVMIIAFFQVSCSVDVANFPFDEQICHINIAVWGYDTKEITILGNMRESPEWSVQNSAWDLRATTVEGINTDQIPFLQVTLFTARRFEYFLINVLLPPILLSLVSPWVFLLPAASGERMSFAITCFLAFGVFMGLLSDNMPKSSVPIAHLSYFLMYMLIQSCAVTVCTIISLRVYHKAETTDEVPGWLSKFVSFVRLHPCRKRCVSSEQHTGPSSKDYVLETPVVTLTNTDIHGANDCDVKPKYRSPSLEANNDTVGKFCVTWYTVGRTLDVFLFVVFLSWMLFTTVTSLMALRLI